MHGRASEAAFVEGPREAGRRSDSRAEVEALKAVEAELGPIDIVVDDAT